MTHDDFWNIVEKVNRNSGGDMDRKCEMLEKELRKLSLGEVVSFHEHFYGCMDRAYDYNLWAAAYIIGHGCGDDNFMDFRATLISMGREIFEHALVDPQWLAEIDYNAENADYEGYQYVPTMVEKELSGGKLPPIRRSFKKEPSGQSWREDKEVAERYPRLAEKYNFATNHPKPWFRRLFMSLLY